ncbi:hypothetical protein NKH61_27745 [Mesorhizobium sp. M1005]|uniref:hypothetical protein n=1 Tax=unclassified Mesorhizobium TaxID=325217 RepID=UPI003339EF44
MEITLLSTASPSVNYQRHTGNLLACTNKGELQRWFRMEHSVRFFMAALILPIIFFTCQAKAAVDDTLFKRWVGRAFLTLDCTSPAAQPSDISQRFADPAAVKAGWAFLKRCRDDGLTSSPEAVAAENYLYIRFVAGQTGDTGFKVLPWSYYLLKTAGSAGGFLQAMRSNPNNPVSEPDPDVRKWGNQGYEDGIMDYESRTGQTTSLKTNAAEVAWKYLADVFY